MTNQFSKATKRQARLRMALIGPSGSGKTYTALTLAGVLGARVAVIDTERGSASKYADLFNFDVLELDTFSPKTYSEAIRAAASAGYDVLVIDSLSHAWMGTGGALELVDQAAARNRGENRFTAWKDVTPLHNELVNTIIQSPLHVIATMRAKTDYVMEEYTDGNGRKKNRPVKVGLAPIQRDGVEYEFDIVADMDLDNRLIVSKSRMSALSGVVVHKPTADLARTIAVWLSDGSAPLPRTEPEKANGSKRGKLVERYQALVEQATALGITPEPVESFSDDELIEAGKALKAMIEARRQPEAA